MFNQIAHVHVERIDGFERGNKTGIAVEGREPCDEIVLKCRVNGSAACAWADDDGTSEASQVGEHGGREGALRTEQTIAESGEHGAMSASSFLFIVNDEFPFVGIKTNASTFIADAEGIFTGTGGHFHEHLSLVFGVGDAGHELDGFGVLFRQGEGEGELDERMFTESLSSFRGAGTSGVFGGDEKAMGITEGTITHDLLDGQRFRVSLVSESGSSASITHLAGRAEWAASGFEIFSQEHRVKVFGDIATAGICFGAAR